MPNLILSQDAADSSHQTIKADWTFNQQLDGVTQSFVRIDWGDGTIDPVASGTTTKSHAYAVGAHGNIYKEVQVTLLGNDVTVTRRIEIGNKAGPYYNPETADVIDTPWTPVWDEALRDAEIVLPIPNPNVEGDPGNDGIKPTPFASPVRNMGR